MRLLIELSSGVVKCKDCQLQVANKEKDGYLETILFVLGIIGIASVMILDKHYWNTNLLKKGPPDFHLGHLIRSATIFLSILAIVWGLIGAARSKSIKLILDENNKLPLEQLSIFGLLSLSMSFLLLFIFDSSTFSNLSLEDNPIEWGSYFLLLASSIVFIATYIKSIHISNITILTKTSFLILALVFFFMSMEEISWFQRLGDIKTPNAFAKNAQHEMNLHNFSTSIAENLYYFGSFIFLVAVPFIRLLFPKTIKQNYLKTFLPRPFIGTIGTIACAYNFDNWNVVFIQIAYMGSISILLAFAIFSHRKKERYIVLFTLFVVIATQVIFLLNGEKFSRTWEVTEYKELFIPLVFFIYALDVYFFINQNKFKAKK